VFYYYYEEFNFQSTSIPVKEDTHLCHVVFYILYATRHLRGKRGEITRSGFVEERNLRRGIFA
jgi:hypothetical protein